MASQRSILCVANWPSDVGYAWWLMESYWVKIAEIYAPEYNSIIAYPEINSLPTSIEQSNIQCIEHPFRSKRIIGAVKNLPFIWQHNVKMIYLSDHGPVNFAYLLYRLFGVKVIIVHDHTPGLRVPPKGIKRWLKKFVARLPWITADAAFGATGFVKDRLINVSCVPASRCYAIQNGIVVADHNEKGVHPITRIFPADKKVIVTASRANKYKGISFALDVVARLANIYKQDDFVYLFCGDGPDLEEFKQKAEKLGIADRCFFPGRVDNIQQLFTSCHIAFQPSNGEVGYSLSILEYMVNRLPVVVPDNPSVCEATTHDYNGKIYPDKNIEAAADTIAAYLSDENIRQQHGEAARKEVLEQYTLKSTHQALENALKKVFKK